MTPRDLLEQAATLVLGGKWQRPLARLLAVDDRLVRRWAAGDRPVPVWVLERLRSELEIRAAGIERVLGMYPRGADGQR